MRVCMLLDERCFNLSSNMFFSIQLKMALYN